MTSQINETWADAPELFCSECGYNLRGTTSARCPECGWEIDRTDVARSRLPWSYRGREIARWPAYRRTVWMGTWRIKRLAGEVVRPVDLPDARRFATVTALLAGVPLAAAMLAIMIGEGGTNFLNPFRGDPSPVPRQLVGPAADLTVPFAAGITRWPVLPAMIVLFLWMLARTPSWLFRTRGDMSEGRRSRAAALGYYTCAPLAFVPAGLMMWVGGFIILLTDPLEGGGLYRLYVALVCGGIVIVLLCFFLCWLNALRLLRRTLHVSGARVLWTAVVLPVSWAMCGVIAFLAIPWVVGFVWLMIDSMRGG